MIKYYYILIVILGVVVVWFALRFAFGVNNPFYVVAAGSMMPTLNVSDFVIIKHANDGSSSFNGLKVGDIIVFKTPSKTGSEGEHKVVVHRVADIRTDKYGNRIIRTKGDANPSSIPLVDYPIKGRNYIGKVVYIIPHFGLITRMINPPINYVIITIIIISAILFLYLKVIKKKEIYSR